MKRCYRCREEKPVAEFYRDKSKKDGLSSGCKPCCAEARDAARAAKPEHYRKMHAAWHRRHYAANWSYYQKKSWRQFCERRGLENTPEIEAYAAELFSDPCSYCDTRPANGVDHIVPIRYGGEHDPGNLTACCWVCNSRKWTQPLLGFLLVRDQYGVEPAELEVAA
jgi:5-methylcytosine-specific restriction endonuclease McrA